MPNSKEPHFSYLLYMLLLTIAVAPGIEDYITLRIAFDLFLSLTLVMGCFVVSQRKALPWIELALAIPMLLSVWAGYLNFNLPGLAQVGKISGILFFTLIAGVILTYVFSCQKVTWEVISAALVVFLLLGTIWGLGYALVELTFPGSFRAAEHLTKDGNSGFIYYSFITLTTVGYGDVTPISGLARSLAMLEGIVGQGYMTVLVARLVGLQVAASSSGKL